VGLMKATFHYTTVGSGPHDGRIEDCAVCVKRAEWAREHAPQKDSDKRR